MKAEQKCLFELGQIVATPGALEALARNRVSATPYLRSHALGDWGIGIVCDEDKQSNDEALRTGARLLSAYFLPDETKLWIITDAAVDEQGTRQVTTLLLPEEY